MQGFYDGYCDIKDALKKVDAAPTPEDVGRIVTGDASVDTRVAMAVGVERGRTSGLLHALAKDEATRAHERTLAADENVEEKAAWAQEKAAWAQEKAAWALEKAAWAQEKDEAFSGGYKSGKRRRKNKSSKKKKRRRKSSNNRDVLSGDETPP
jgi:hypothetical protein